MTFDLGIAPRHRLVKLAQELTWDAYNKLVDEFPELESEEAYAQFEEQVGDEIESALIGTLEAKTNTTEAAHE